MRELLRRPPRLVRDKKAFAHCVPTWKGEIASTISISSVARAKWHDPWSLDTISMLNTIIRTRREFQQPSWTACMTSWSVERHCGYFCIVILATFKDYDSNEDIATPTLCGSQMGQPLTGCASKARSQARLRYCSRTLCSANRLRAF